jgi:hypothetical protein
MVYASLLQTVASLPLASITRSSVIEADGKGKQKVIGREFVVELRTDTLTSNDSVKVLAEAGQYNMMLLRRIR